MTWQGILGHDTVVEWLRKALVQGRLGSSFLFVGPSGIGKRTFALRLAQALLCQERPEEMLDPCGCCPACVQVVSGGHPDLFLVGKPADKQFIPVASFIGDDEHRMQDGLCHHLSLRPFMGGRRIAIIDDADFLNEAGANCLLKTLEEPPPRSVLILIGTSPSRQLPTIRSRCQLVRFSPLSAHVLEQLLIANGSVSDRAEARALAALSEGSLDRAHEMVDADLRAFRDELFLVFSRRLDGFAALVKRMQSLVDDAGSEAPARRARLRQIMTWAIQFYRGALRTANGLLIDDANVADASGRWVRDGLATPDSILRCLDCCLTAMEQIDRNVNQTTLIESWLNDLAGLSVVVKAAATEPR